MRKLRIFILVLLALIGAGWLAADIYVAPRLAGWIGNIASQQLGQPVVIGGAHISLSGLQLTDVKLSSPQAVVIEEVIVEGTYRDMLNRHVPRVKLSGVVIAMEAPAAGADVKQAEPLSVALPLPLSAERRDSLPLDILEIENIKFSYRNGAHEIMLNGGAKIDFTASPTILHAGNVQGSYHQGANEVTAKITLTLDLIANPASLILHVSELKGSWEKNPFTVDAATLTLAQEKVGIWSGDVNVPQASSEKLPPWLGALSMKSIVQIDAECVNWQPAQMQDAAQHFSNQSSGYYCWAGKNLGFKTSLKGMLVSDLAGRVQWNGALNPDQQLALQLAIQALPLGRLMDELAQGKLSATGNVSGTIPLQYNLATKRWKWSKGTLKADGPGTLTLGAGVLPADMGNLSMVSDLLSNLHYQVLELHVSADPEQPQKPMVEMKVQGNNPLVMEGKPVKLNVRLSGDLLEVLQSSLLPLQNPEEMVKSHE